MKAINSKKSRGLQIVQVIALCSTAFAVGVGIFLTGCLQIDFTGLPAKSAPRVGIVVDKQMRVVFVEKESPAETAGVQKGDILKGFNKRNFAAASEGMNIISKADFSKPITLKFLRGAQDITLEVEPLPLVGTKGAPTPTPVPSDLTYF